MPRLFTIPNVWAGGHFDLLLGYEGGSPARLRAAHNAIWSRPEMQGPYELDDVEPDEQEVVAFEECREFYGVLRTPRGQVPCLSLVLFHDSDRPLLNLAVPMASLAPLYPVGSYPFADGTPLQWPEQVTACLFVIAQTV